MSAAHGTRSIAAPSGLVPLLREATAASVSYAVLRGRDALFGPEPSAGRTPTATVLVDEGDRAELERLAERHGLTNHPHPSGDLTILGGAPHDEDEPRQILHVTTRLRYGGRHRWLTTGFDESRLLRRAELVGDVRVVSLADELVDALLHGLLDLGAFPPDERHRIRDLMRRLRNAPVLAGRAAERVQQELAPALGWGWLLAAIVTEQWDAILDRRPAVRRHLARRAPLSSAGRWASSLSRSASRGGVLGDGRGTRGANGRSERGGPDGRRGPPDDGAGPPGDRRQPPSEAAGPAGHRFQPHSESTGPASDRADPAGERSARTGAGAAPPGADAGAHGAAGVEPEEDARDGKDPGASGELTDRQLRGSSLLLAGRGLSTGFKFIAELIVVRYLATAEYGSWTYALSAIVFLRGLSTLGLNRAVTRFVPIHLERSEHRDLAGVVTFVLGLLLLSGATLVTAFFVFPDQVARIAGISEQQPIDLLFILVFLVPIEATDDFLTGICAAFTDSKTIFVRRYLLNPSLRLGIAVALVLLQADVRWLAYAYLVSGLVGLAYYTWSVVGELRKRGLMDRGLFRGMHLPVRRVLSYTVPVMGADWCAILLTTTSPLLLGYFTEMSTVALFQVVVPLVAINRLVAQSFGVLFEPSAARMLGRDDREGLNRLYWRSAAWVAVLSFPAFAVSFTAAEPLTVLLFGDRYAAAAPILSLLAVGYFADAMLGFNSAAMRVAGQIKTLLLVNVTACAVNVVLHLILIPRYGALGAGIATATSWVLYSVLKQVALHFTTGIRGFDTGLGAAYGVIGLAGVALLLTRLQWSENVWIVGGAAALASVAVLARARAKLSITTTFPELAQYSIVRRLIG